MTVRDRLAECLELGAIGDSGAEAMHDALVAARDIAQRYDNPQCHSIIKAIDAELAKVAP